MIIHKIKKLKWKSIYVPLLTFIGILLMVGINASSHSVTMDYNRSWQAVSGTGGVYGPLPLIKVDNQTSWCLQANKVLETGTNTLIDFSDIGITAE
ncbi:MAG: hypothetical protein ACK5LC_11330 [Coprobacillaceae bacterium]